MELSKQLYDQMLLISDSPNMVVARKRRLNTVAEKCSLGWSVWNRNAVQCFLWRS
jgi:hypothetical protein